MGIWSSIAPHRKTYNKKGTTMPAKNGDTVLVHYTGTLADGAVFDSSRDGEPLEATLGDGMLIPGFEKALAGMSAGDVKTVVIQPQEAYGEHLPELVLVIPREDVPDTIKPEPGMMVQLAMTHGEEFEAAITDVNEKEVTLDANHPLAGEALTFEIELVGVK